MPAIQVNTDRLSSIIKSNLVEFFGKPLTPELIDLLTKQIAQTVDDFLNKDELDIK